jgi:hypothetical protein
MGIDVRSREVKDMGAGGIGLIVMLGEASDVRPAVCPRAKWRTWKISDPCRDPAADLDALRNARDEINSKLSGLFLDYWRNLA